MRGHKQRRRITPKQRAVVEAFVKNPDITLREAGEKAGYSADPAVKAHRALSSVAVREAFLEAFRANPNLANSKLAQKIAEGLDATVVKVFKGDEDTIIESKEYVDYPTRASYLALAAKLGGIEPNRVELTGANGAPLNPPAPALDAGLQVLLAKLSKEELIAVLSGSAPAPSLPSIEVPPREGA